MSKQSFRSFQDLDPSHFASPKDERSGPKDERFGRTAGVSPKNRAKDAPGLEDESALFLAAVAGNVDVSQKHTTVPRETPPSRGERKAAASPERELPQPAPRQDTPVKAVRITPEETNLFAEAMSGVNPIRARGRDLAPPAKPAPPAHGAAMADLEELILGKLEFSLEYTEEFVQGHVLGLDPLVLEKLKAGSYSPEAHVDLHGQNMEQAYATLAAFIRHAYQDGKRHLIVVTGRGKNSPGGQPVLRERVQSWFTRDPFKRVVLGFCTAKPGDGGAGALYLLLRKRRKNQGKIVWDNRPSEEELLL